MFLPSEIYFDDTGCNKEPVFQWCGILANKQYWAEFSERWRAVLDAPPRVPYWDQKSVRSIPRPAPFDALTDQQVREKEEALASLVGWTTPGGGRGAVAVVVRIPARYHQEYVKGKIRFGSKLTHRQRKELGIQVLERPHYIGFEYASHIALHIMNQWKEQPLPLNYVVEARADDPYQRLAERGVAMAKRVLAPHIVNKMGTLTFAPGKTGAMSPLEAADMLAWHMGQRAWRRGVDDPMWPRISRLVLNTHTVTATDLMDYVQRWNDGEARLAEQFGKQR